MTRVEIYQDTTEPDSQSYHAVSGHVRGEGRTAGEALDALATQLPKEETDTFVIIRTLAPDMFFPAHQRARLEELMGLKAEANRRGVQVDPEVLTELEALIDAELRATAERAGALGNLGIFP